MKNFAIVLVASLFSTCVFAQSGDRGKMIERVDASGTVLNEIMAAPDNAIPNEILGSAKCIAVVPSMLKAGFVIGGNYGRGVASCRTDKGWSAPAFFAIEGGSVGFQIGGQAVDLVMVVMNEGGMKTLLASKFKLGADASVAAGPVGRHAEGSTDWKMRAEVLTYSRARGVFAGISLNGASIRQDQDATRSFYGHMIPYRSLLTGATPVPADANPFIEALGKYSGSGTVSATTKGEPKPAEAKPAETKPIEGTTPQTPPANPPQL